METQSVNGDINYYKQCFTLDPSQMAGVPCSTHARSMFLEVALGGGVLGVRRTLASDFSSVNPGTVSHFCNLDLAVRQNLFLYLKTKKLLQLKEIIIPIIQIYFRIIVIRSEQNKNL